MSGDALYPTASGTQTSVNEEEENESSFEEVGIYMNRIEFSSPVACRIICNIDDPHGHKKPMNLIDLVNQEMKTLPKL